MEKQGILFGGIAGWSNTNIENCYSKGSVNGGGIVNNLQSYSTKVIKNCYNISIVSGNGAIVSTGKAYTLNNCYYLAGTCKYASQGMTNYAGVTSKNEEYMKSQAFVDVLNNGEDNWKRDDNINSGYPILKSIKYREQ